ncbi:MAG: hypothetical protein ABF242_05530 [Flavobacteriales bacterium]
MKTIFSLLVGFLLLNSCDTGFSNNKNQTTLSQEVEFEELIPEEIEPVFYKPIIRRDSIIKNIKTKIANNQSLVVHVFVPLCDNENQGIVPTSPKLGNGLDLRNNLYWGVRHGMKTIFKLNKKWELVNSYNPADTNVLERVIFKREYGKATINLVMDAYRGDKMKETLEDYFNSLAENKMDSIYTTNESIGIYGNADLIAFNGHNGLMDTEISYEITKKNIRQKDAISISCSSIYYFENHLKKMNAYPLVTTQHNLYPGGFIMEGIIDRWATFAKDELIRQEAGNAYHRAKNCGIKGARNIFYTGWEK